VVADRAEPVAAQRKDDDLGDDFLNDYADNGLASLDHEEQYCDPDTRMADVEENERFVPCQKSMLFSSQETPPTAFTKPAKLDILSPNTLRNVGSQAVKGDLPNYNKKSRKRSKKNVPSSSSQLAPKSIWV
jgi:hypothetical protein